MHEHHLSHVDGNRFYSATILQPKAPRCDGATRGQAIQILIFFILSTLMQAAKT